MKEKLTLILSVTQTLILIAILAILLNDRTAGRRSKSSRNQPETPIKIDKPLTLLETDAVWGKMDAPNTIVAFVDYQCPFCIEVYANMKDIEKEYIETGKVKIIFRDFPLRMHKSARYYAAAVECARRQGKFWELADRILDFKTKADSASIDAWVDELKMNKDNFKSCLVDTTVENMIQNDINEAKYYGIRGTPALIVNNVYYRGTLSPVDLKDILRGKAPARSQNSGNCNQK
jgi:protein-disulfide isomerase